MDCTTMGCPPPTLTFPTFTATDWRRFCAAMKPPETQTSCESLLYRANLFLEMIGMIRLKVVFVGLAIASGAHGQEPVSALSGFQQNAAKRTAEWMTLTTNL